MDPVGIAEIVSAVAEVFGFGFAFSEVRRYRERKARESALALVGCCQTSELASAVLLLVYLEEGLSLRSWSGSSGWTCAWSRCCCCR